MAKVETTLYIIDNESEKLLRLQGILLFTFFIAYVFRDNLKSSMVSNQRPLF